MTASTSVAARRQANAAPPPEPSLVPAKPDSRLNPALLATLRRFAKVAALLVAVAGMVELLGWFLRNDTLRSILPGHAIIKANTVVAFILAGIALSLLNSTPTRIRNLIAGVLAGVVVAVGALTLLEDAFALNLHIDQLLFTEPAGLVDTVSPGRMAPNTAFAFVLLGAAMLLLLRPTVLRRHIGDSMSVFAAIVALLAILGYAYDLTVLYGLAQHSKMSLPAAITFTLLSAGVLCTHPERGIVRILASDGVGSLMLRRFLPLALIVPPLVGWLTLHGTRKGFYGGNMEDVLFAIVVMLVLTAVVFWNAHSLDRTDAQRDLAESVLRRSRDQWELTFNCMSEGLSYHNPDYTIIGANQSFFHMLGHDDVAGKKCYQAVHGMECPPGYCPMARTLVSGNTESGEFFEPRLQRYLSVRTDPVLDSEGKITRIVHVVADITAKKQAEAAIRRLAAIVESSDDAIIGKDLDGIIVSWNRGAEGLYGYTAAEAVGQPIAIICPPETRDDYRMLLEKIRNGERVESFETQRVRRDGAHIDVSLTVSPIHDADGKIVGASTIARDITEKKRTQEELLHRGFEAEQARTQLNAVLASMGEGLYQLDSAGCVVYLNPAGEAVLGYRLDDIRGRNMHHLIHSHFPDGTPRPAEDCPLLAVIHGGQPAHSFEDWFQRADGSFFPVECTSSPLKMAGKITGAVLSFRDISERRLAEERERRQRREIEAKGAQIAQLNADLEERVRLRTHELEVTNRELEAFSYSVSHDLRAPLRSIDGFSQILLEEFAGNLDSEGQEFLKRVRSASQHMGQLIDALLQLSRITRSEMGREPVDLSRLGQEIAEALKQSAPSREVTIRVMPGMKAFGDPRLLHVALNNLLGNAFKFTARSENAEIEFGTVVHEGEPVYFVKDNGAGFQMEYAHKLFGAFQRLHAVTDFEGSGIGLATVQRIIRRHGGRVWAEGEPGQGAIFYFTLP